MCGPGGTSQQPGLGRSPDATWLASFLAPWEQETPASPARGPGASPVSQRILMCPSWLPE